jgi:hypothetical protein
MPVSYDDDSYFCAFTRLSEEVPPIGCGEELVDYLRDHLGTIGAMGMTFAFIQVCHSKSSHVFVRRLTRST